MAAYNYIVFERECPQCGVRAKLRAQTHIASDYEGDESGRFMEHDYRLGERMRWFPPGSDDYDTWDTWGTPPNTGAIREMCVTVCTHCGAKLRAVVEFEDVTPVRIRELELA